MAPPFIQASFNSGEWAPHLLARTDLEKYHSGAALLENFFVDYRGGASTRSGTRWILRGYKDSTAIRLIPFQAAISVAFALEFGDHYIRFHRNGAPVLEAGIAITGVSLTNPCVINVANSFATGDVDWVFISGVSGTTQLNGNYYIVHAASPTQITIYDLFGNPVDATGFGAWISGGTVQRVYTIASPYAPSDLALIKFTQNIDVLILCHPDYNTQLLTFSGPTSWVLSAIVIGTQIAAPTGVTVASTLAKGNVFYSYIVTAVDSTGEESAVSTAATLSNKADLRTVAGTNTVSWNPVAGAVSYNVYKSDVSYLNPVPTGSFYGFCGNVTGTSLADSNIAADFSQPPPIVQNPFAVGSTVNGALVTNPGSYTATPLVIFDPPGGSGTTATGVAIMGAATATVSAGGTTYVVGDQITLTNGVILTVLTLSGSAVATALVTFPANTTATPLATNPVAQASSSGSGTGATFNLTYGVDGVAMTANGSGYSSVPNVSFSLGAAAATATLSSASGGNPSVPCFFQQRLVLAAPENSPTTLFMSQPGNFYNFNTSNPIQEDNAITATLISGELSNIKSLVPQPGGLIVYTDDTNVLINGGSLGAAVTPSATVANQQSHVGCNDMPPIVVNFDILTVQSKGSSVRDSTYNFYANVYTGSDITIISSHLFFGFQLTEWGWVEEPYKTVWAVRNDGALLCLTFIKEQEFIAWTHHMTLGSFKSVCTIVEAASAGFQNFLYTVVQRTVNAQTVKYIEYFPERPVSNSAQDYWTVDAAVAYSGPPVSSFSGAQFLAGLTVTGLADGSPITPFVMPATGNFTLPAPASNVKIGIGFTCNLQTLYIDLGQPTVQTKMKAMPSVALRVTQTLGLKIGSDASNLVVMKDLVVGNVGSMTNERVTGLVTGDAMTFLDPKWQEAGQVYVRQDQPYPASVLGFIPRVAVAELGARG